MAITSILDLTFTPENVPNAEERLRDILSATRAFPGNLGVDVVADVTNPARMLLIEHWESTDADAAYRAWRATPDGRSGLSDLLVGAPVTDMYEGLFSL